MLTLTSTEKTFDRLSNAIVRKPAPNFAKGLAAGVGIPDYSRTIEQFDQYVAALKTCGVGVTVLPPDPEFPDAGLIADTAVVAGSLAIISNFPSDNPRQGEQKTVASTLAADRFLKFIAEPGYMDAADVLQIRDHYYITVSSRTNREGATQTAFYLKEFGYPVSIIEVEDADTLRFSSSACYLGKDRLLVREEVAKHYAFIEYEKIIVPAHESIAASAMMANGTLILPTGCTETQSELRMAGIPFMPVAFSEFQKLNIGISALSLRLQKQGEGNIVTLPSNKTVRAG